MSTYSMSLETARYEIARRLRAADDERQRRLARRGSFRRTHRADAGTMCR